jgi:hypothetical protein
MVVMMAQPVSTPHGTSGRVTPVIVTGGAAVGAVLLVGAAALWWHYGTTVFFETIAAGFSACF